MNQDETLSLSILKAFGIPPDKLKIASKHLGETILSNFLNLVDQEASPVEKNVLTAALRQFNDDPKPFTNSVSEVMANNQTLQEKTARMINDLYRDLIRTFTDHASPEERQRFDGYVAKEQLKLPADPNL